jgi:predicted ester cyclase
MTAESNIANVRRLLEEAFSQGEHAIIDEIVAPDCVEHQNGSQGTGPEAVHRTVRRLHSSFPDLRLDVQDIVASEDTVWVRVRGRGTDTGGVAGRAPSGRAFEIDIIDIMRFREGMMVDHWGVADRLGMLQQVGAMPAPQQRTA